MNPFLTFLPSGEDLGNSFGPANQLQNGGIVESNSKPICKFNHNGQKQAIPNFETVLYCLCILSS